ncbi:MAG: hypothetical protein R3E48_03065 [Burkholderiaceae bacterium]
MIVPCLAAVLLLGACGGGDSAPPAAANVEPAAPKPPPTPNTITASLKAGQEAALQRIGATEAILDDNSVTYTFVSDLEKSATRLSITTTLAELPAGWSMQFDANACQSVPTDGCELSLRYAPTGAASGSLTIGFAYTDSEGDARTGSLVVPYTASLPPLAYLTRGESAGTAMPRIVRCVLETDGQFSHCTDFGPDLSFAGDIAVDAGHLYLSAQDALSTGVFQCAIDAASANVSGCTLARPAYEPVLLLRNGALLIGDRTTQPTVAVAPGMPPMPLMSRPLPLDACPASAQAGLQSGCLSGPSDLLDWGATLRVQGMGVVNASLWVATHRIGGNNVEGDPNLTATGLLWMGYDTATGQATVRPSTGGITSFALPVAALTPLGGVAILGRHAYFATQAGVVHCDADAVSGALSNCAAPVTSVPGIAGQTLADGRFAVNGTRLYYADASGSITCVIGGGALDACVPLAAPAPTRFNGIAFR